MSLLFNVSQLLKSTVGQSRSYDFATEEVLDLGDGTATGVEGHVKFTLTNFGVLAVIHAEASLHLTCARCVEIFEQRTSVDFEEEFQPEIDVLTGAPSTVPRTETAFSISSNHLIDLQEPVRQQLVLAIEMVPICSPDCAGLCASCGVNRNREDCTCAPVEFKSPFAVLQDLLPHVDSPR